jgi:hypothetical protein
MQAVPGLIEERAQLFLVRPLDVHVINRKPLRKVP